MKQTQIDIFVKDLKSSELETVDENGCKITGYTIYNAEQQRRTKRNDLPSLYPDLPEKKFDIIYADPPWDYNGKMQFDKSGRAENFDISKKIFISSANFKYPTLKTADMMKIPIHEIANDDCLLFMWATSPHLEQAIELGKEWGFEWRIPSPRGARNIQQLVRSPRGKHSEKPKEVLDAIEKMFPTQDRIELFARKKPKGWSVWGLDVREEYAKQTLEQEAF